MKSLTKAQAKALETLRAMSQPFTVIERAGYFPYIHTGLNTQTLYGLKMAGAIEFSSGYLRGHVSPDLRIVEGGR